MKICKVDSGRDKYKRIRCSKNHFLGKKDKKLYFYCKICKEFFAYEDEDQHLSCKK